MDTERPPYGLIGFFLFAALNALLGERKPAREPAGMDDEEAGKVTKSAVGAAFVDKSTADAIVAMREDVKVIRDDVKAMRSTVEDNAERQDAAELEKRLEGSIENRINRALERIEHKHRDD